MKCPTCKRPSQLEQTAEPSDYVAEWQCPVCKSVFVSIILLKVGWKKIFGMPAVDDDVDRSEASQDAAN